MTNELTTTAQEILPVRVSDGAFKPQRVSIVLYKNEIENIVGTPFISADAYCRIAQAAAISVRVVGEMERKYDGRGGLVSVKMRMQGLWRNPAGELQQAEEEMELRVDELLEEARSKKAKQLNIEGDPIYDGEGRLLRVVYKLPPAEEAKLYEESMRTRMFLDRKLATRIRARITKALTGITPKSLPAPDKEGNRKLTVVRMLPADSNAPDSTELYGDADDDDTDSKPIDANYKPAGKADGEQAEKTTDQQAQTNSNASADRTHCADCRKELSAADITYFQKNSGYTPRCYSCNQKRREAKKQQG